jgi:hypothetical protein
MVNSSTSPALRYCWNPPRLHRAGQGQYFDGGDQALQREIGCGGLSDALGEELASAQ